ncbi:unnamed protein product [Bemisia tabaci]|uniref:E3 ubiquitin-protein ligase RNF181 n=1 Tax=Bemisia tabaci TaxID=7038 RepID=A0A9P0AKV6_BEMTA|nr:unnamed protein product [Bemisia tabaci]
MADYFQEMGWEELREGESPNHLLHLARLLRDYGMFQELGEDQRLPPPAAKSVVDSLEEITVSSEESQCSVCLKNFSVNEIAKKLPCKHFFHPSCILPWLSKTNSCPVCRHELQTDDESYELYRKEKIRAVQREKDIESLHDSMFS